MLSAKQLAQYHDDGFLIVRDFFSRGELQPLMDEIDQLVAELADRLKRAGKITNTHADEGFYTRLTRLEKDFPRSSVLVHIAGILRPALAGLWSSEKLLDVVQQIIGPEIAGHPVWNLRSKTPNNPLATVPWHQDTAYLAEGAEKTFQPTAWIPLIDADKINGTLQVLRSGHRSGKVFQHRLENKKNRESWYLYIEEKDLPPGDVVTCEMPMGSVLLLNQLVPHRSTENKSDKIRWSVDLRWQRPSEISGFEGIKDPILMRTARDPKYKVNWGQWATQNRVADGLIEKTDKRDQFDAMVSGPWMLRWEEPQVV